ncbi:MAG: DUF6754 domain-containing protein [Myxococcota bacterium]
MKPLQATRRGGWGVGLALLLTASSLAAEETGPASGGAGTSPAAVSVPAGIPAGAPLGASVEATRAAGETGADAAPPAAETGGETVGETVGAPAARTPLRPPTALEVKAPPDSDGLTLSVSWTPSPDDGTPALTGYVVFRATTPTGPFLPVSAVLQPGTKSYRDKVTTDPHKDPPAERYYYRVAARQLLEPVVSLHTQSSSSETADGAPVGDWFDNTKLSLLLLIVLFASLMFYYTSAIRNGAQLFIRRIPGIDAIEEAIGRSTEMGKPILYVPGIDELQDIQTIASMLILGRVAEIVANYESDMIVPCTYPMVREVADEVVRAGYYMAGRPDAYDARNVRFISSEQFAFCAGTNGIILRQKPAANIFLGRFFAESLIFAETGFVNKSIQIAGTAEPTQLPFFVVSCDYTVIGEELFAVSAYLSKDPRLVSSLRASDIIKALVVVSVMVGTVLSTVGVTAFAAFWSGGGH